MTKIKLIVSVMVVLIMAIATHPASARERGHRGAHRSSTRVAVELVLVDVREPALRERFHETDRLYAAARRWEYQQRQPLPSPRQPEEPPAWHLPTREEASAEVYMNCGNVKAVLRLTTQGQHEIVLPPGESIRLDWPTNDVQAFGIDHGGTFRRFSVVRQGMTLCICP